LWLDNVIWHSRHGVTQVGSPEKYISFHFLGNLKNKNMSKIKIIIFICNVDREFVSNKNGPTFNLFLNTLSTASQLINGYGELHVVIIVSARCHLYYPTLRRIYIHQET